MDTLEQIVIQHDQRLERLEDIASNQQGALRAMQQTLGMIQKAQQETNHLLENVLQSQERQLNLLEQLVTNTNGRQ